MTMTSHGGSRSAVLLAVVSASIAALVLTNATCWAASPEGPRLDVSRARLAAALTCSRGLAHAKHNPVLLTPAFSTAEQSYGINYLRRLPQLGIPTCSVTVRDQGYGDLQRTAEYDVYAIRRMAAISGRKIDVLGHQHGALDHLWAMTFWPDVGRDVGDFVSLATPYNGTTSSSGICTATSDACGPALWQITKGSRFLAALAHAPLPNGPSYTSIGTRTDTLVTPEPAASRLPGARNVMVQDRCPGRTVDHFMMISDAVAYALVLDAFRHRGPADPARVPRSVCSRHYMPGVVPAAVPTAGLFLPLFLSRNKMDAVPREPTGRSYAERRGPAIEILTRSARRTSHGRIAVRVRCRSIGATACRITLGGVTARVPPPGTTLLSLRVGPTLRHLRVTLRARDALGNTAVLRRSITVLKARR